MEKRYFWIKLKTDFFSMPEIDFLMSQQNGAQYVVLYEMLCLLTANNGGRLCTEMGEIIVPYDTDKIVRETKYFNRDTVMVALELYTKLGLIYMQDDGTLKIAKAGEMVGSESSSAARVRKMRESQKRLALQCNTSVTNNVTTDIDIDNRDKIIDIDIEKEREKDADKPRKPARKKKEVQRHKYGEYSNVLLSDAEIEKLQTEFPQDYQQRIERLDSYLEQSGKHYKSHLATIRNWARRDQQDGRTGSRTRTGQQDGDNNYITGDLPF